MNYFKFRGQKFELGDRVVVISTTCIDMTGRIVDIEKGQFGEYIFTLDSDIGQRVTYAVKGLADIQRLEQFDLNGLSDEGLRGFIDFLKHKRKQGVFPIIDVVNYESQLYYDDKITKEEKDFFKTLDAKRELEFLENVWNRRVEEKKKGRIKLKDLMALTDDIVFCWDNALKNPGERYISGLHKCLLDGRIEVTFENEN